jgi:uncharacterized protein (TIGR00369 family)
MADDESAEFSDFVAVWAKGDSDRDAHFILEDGTPQTRALGIERIDISRDGATYKLPYSDRLVGDPLTGVIHGGAVTVLLDSCCGGATLAIEAKPIATATLDLRIDYMRSAKPGCDIYARASCYRVGRDIAFVRGVAYDESPNDLVAAATGAFILTFAKRDRVSK